MASWGHVRIPNFTSKEIQPCHTPANGSSFLETPTLQDMRDVKRNPFPADLLKTKEVTKPSLRTAASRFCRIQVFDIVGRNYDFLSRLSDLKWHGILRRSRSERKKDWEMAMLWLMEGNGNPLRDKIQEAWETMAPPVVESILLSDNCRSAVSAGELPIMLLIPPSKSISLLSVESNMCFEVEFLRSILAETGLHHGLGERMHENHHFTKVLESLVSTSSVMPLGRSSRKKIIETAVMKSTHHEKSSRIGNIDDNSGSSLLHSVLENGKVPWIRETRRFSLQELNIADTGELEKYKVSLMASQAESSRLLQACCSKSLIAGNDWNDVVDAHILKRDQMKEARCVEEIWRPIFLRKIDSSSSQFEVKTSIGKICPTRSTLTSMTTSGLFASLSGYRGPLLTCEKSMWSKASKDILIRSKYKRRRILLSKSHTASLVLASSQSFAKSITVKDYFSSSGPLDSLVFQNLRGIFTSLDESQNRNNSLLDKLDFVATLVSRSRQRFLEKSYERVDELLNQYDSPIRKWSRVHCESILPRSELRRHCSEGARESAIFGNGPKNSENIDSDESALEIFSLSDDGFEGENEEIDGFLMLKEIHEDLRHHGSLQNGVKTDVAKGQQRERDVLREAHTETRKKLKVRLKVPDALVCTPWVLQTAEHCIQKMLRGALFIPTPLSVLPVLAVVINSHLRDSVRDQRVAVVCESQTGLTENIREYLHSSLGESVSIDLIKRSECHGVASIVPLPHTTARVVLLDSFCFSFSVTFSLLIVLVTGEAETFLQDTRLRQQMFESDISQWIRIPCVLLTPIGSRVGLQPYSTAIGHLSKELGASQVLWVKAKDEVKDSILMSCPRKIFLAPTKAAIDLANLLNVHAAPLLQVYISLKQATGKYSTEKASALQDVRFKYVHESMLDQRKDGDPGKHQKLELLYNLRQARTFAIYDGFGTAVEFLEHCSKHAKGQVRRGVRRLLEDLEDRKSDIRSASSTHPVLKELVKSMGEANSSMMQDPPSFRSVHRRDNFLPIIIANSVEAVNGCLQGLEDFVHFNHARGTKAVCSLQELQMESKKQHSGVLQEKLEEFSHVFHIVDDRYDSPSELLLPPVLQQQIHAGRTRLITLAVDETRKRDREWENEMFFYDELTRSLGMKDDMNKLSDVSYLQMISIDSFRLAAAEVFPVSNEAIPETVPSNELNDRYASLPRKHGSVQEKYGTLEMTPPNICSSSVENLREMLLKRLIISPGKSGLLRVRVLIRLGESCTPAITYLYSALAGNEKLRKKVIVETIFLF